MFSFLKVKNSTSKGFSLDLTDAKKLAIDAGIVGSSAAVAYLLDNLAGLNLGDNTALLVPVLAIVLNMVYKYLKDNSPVK